jgi:hypothetical protein
MEIGWGQKRGAFTAPIQSPEPGYQRTSLTPLPLVERIVLMGLPLSELGDITIRVGDPDTKGHLTSVGLKPLSGEQRKIFDALSPGLHFKVVLAHGSPSIEFGPVDGRIGVASVDYDAKGSAYVLVPYPGSSSLIGGGRASKGGFPVSENGEWLRQEADYSTFPSRFKGINWSSVRSALHNRATTTSRVGPEYTVKQGSPDVRGSTLVRSRPADARSEHIPILNKILEAINEGQGNIFGRLLPFTRTNPINIDIGREMDTFLGSYSPRGAADPLTTKQLLFCHLVNRVSALAAVSEVVPLDAESHVKSIKRVLAAIDASPMNDGLSQLVPNQLRMNLTEPMVSRFLETARNMVADSSSRPMQRAREALSLLEQMEPRSFPP